ncbi:MAG: helix-turn-helix domain-containing protein [Pseudolabrys sp.]|nr:helix-turn-helix domain-containing protein [Hyphomicrobiales bacterium]MBV8791248.1 helix-turn-helix domain-containing protein [Pseudolabrys sp.]
MKIQTTKELEIQMRAVARGEIAAPADAARPSAESAATLIRLLTPENRKLMRVIRDAKPKSVSELARLTHRAQPNLLRTLTKLADFGFIEMRRLAHRTVPTPMVGSVYFEIDPYAMADKIRFIPPPAPPRASQARRRGAGKATRRGR